jgi:hypothetical protein
LGRVFLLACRRPYPRRGRELTGKFWVCSLLLIYLHFDSL